MSICFVNDTYKFTYKFWNHLKSKYIYTMLFYLEYPISIPYEEFIGSISPISSRRDERLISYIKWKG